MTQSLLLDRTTWDLVLDANGNIAVCSEPYSLTQDVACAIRLFLGELYYDTTQGVPYFQQILGQLPPAGLFKAQMEAAALTVPGVATAQCFITGVDSSRKLSGQVQITDTAGNANVVAF